MKKIVNLKDIVKFNKLEEVYVEDWNGWIYIKKYDAADAVYYISANEKWGELIDADTEEINEKMDEFIGFISNFLFIHPDEKEENKLIKDQTEYIYFKDINNFESLKQIGYIIYLISYGASPEYINNLTMERKDKHEKFIDVLEETIEEGKNYQEEDKKKEEEKEDINESNN